MSTLGKIFTISLSLPILGVWYIATAIEAYSGGQNGIFVAWKSLYYYGCAMVILIPISFVCLALHKRVHKRFIKLLLVAAGLIDLFFIYLIWSNLVSIHVGSQDAVLLIVLWNVWELAILLAYILKLSVERSTA